ncbi:MAG: phosphoglucomutase/phosphomannomutase family protein [Verrucomicrobia bacterium]|nr:phosphoglucomutase/phosphomannomutase family protein [Verrucomicrobiota bacterium]
MTTGIPEIKFGTSGWRAIISDEFTFDNVALVAEAIARTVLESGVMNGIVIGYDTRFQGHEFARRAAQVCAAAGVPVHFANRDVPTPAVAHQIRALGCAGGINVTASHNPSQYNGIKFSPAYGGPALPEVTTRVEHFVRIIREEGQGSTLAQTPAPINEFDPRPDYAAKIERLINFDAIEEAGLRFAVDAKFGTSRGYLDTLLSDHGIETYAINAYPDPLFGGKTSEPGGDNLDELRDVVLDHRCALGLATDGDGDRFGILDANGEYLEANMIIGLAAHHLYKHHGRTGDVARTRATSHFIDAVCAHHGGRGIQTPVGFKYLGSLLDSHTVFLAGEESGGLSTDDHVPEKDGIYACLLMAEAVAVERKPLKAILADVFRDIGRQYHTTRINVHLDAAKMDQLVAAVQAGVPEALKRLDVAEVDSAEGAKYILANGNWLMFRLSGTEPVARCYIDADSPASLAALESAAREFLKQFA